MILRGDMAGIKEIMAKPEDLGMQTFDRALYKSYRESQFCPK